MHENMCFDVFFLYASIRAFLFTDVSHFYSPLHHNVHIEGIK